MEIDHDTFDNYALDELLLILHTTIADKHDQEPFGISKLFHLTYVWIQYLLRHDEVGAKTTLASLKECQDVTEFLLTPANYSTLTQQEMKDNIYACYRRLEVCEAKFESVHKVNSPSSPEKLAIFEAHWQRRTNDVSRFLAVQNPSSEARSTIVHFYAVFEALYTRYNQHMYDSFDEVWREHERRYPLAEFSAEDGSAGKVPLLDIGQQRILEHVYPPNITRLQGTETFLPIWSLRPIRYLMSNKNSRHSKGHESRFSSHFSVRIPGLPFSTHRADAMVNVPSHIDEKCENTPFPTTHDGTSFKKSFLSVLCEGDAGTVHSWYNDQILVIGPLVTRIFVFCLKMFSRGKTLPNSPLKMLVAARIADFLSFCEHSSNKIRSDFLKVNPHFHDHQHKLAMEMRARTARFHYFLFDLVQCGELYSYLDLLTCTPNNQTMLDWTRLFVDIFGFTYSQQWEYLQLSGSLLLKCIEQYALIWKFYPTNKPQQQQFETMLHDQFQTLLEEWGNRLKTGDRMGVAENVDSVSSTALQRLVSLGRSETNSPALFPRRLRRKETALSPVNHNHFDVRFATKCGTVILQHLLVFIKNTAGEQWSHEPKNEFRFEKRWVRMMTFVILDILSSPGLQSKLHDFFVIHSGVANKILTALQNAPLEKYWSIAKSITNETEHNHLSHLRHQFFQSILTNACSHWFCLDR